MKKISKLNDEQIKKISKEFGITEQEVREKEEVFTNSIAFAFETLRKRVLELWEQIKKHFFPVLKKYKKYTREQNKKFFKKKKSQRKNWKKWRKRK